MAALGLTNEFRKYGTILYKHFTLKGACDRAEIISGGLFSLTSQDALQNPDTVNTVQGISLPHTRQLRLAENNTNNNNSDNQQHADFLDQCDPITGVAVPQNNEVTAITDFMNEACDMVDVRAGAFSKLTEMYKDTNNVTDVSDYFSRPIIVRNDTYLNATRGVIWSQEISNAYLQSALYNFARVKGAYGYRATVCFRVQVISNPFQAGILRLAFSPFERIGFGNHWARSQSLTSVSQLPGVELDLAESTSCVLKIPFIHALNYFTVTPASATESLGSVCLFAYTPVALGSGASNPTLTVWMWLEDFELVAATAAEYSAQSGVLSGKKAATNKESDVVPANLSGVLAAGAKLANWAGTKIPMISSYAGPTSWLMRQAAHIAASYGWSRPLAVLPNTKVINTINAYQNNSDGVDPSFNLGLFSDNAVAPLPGFAGSNLDEMAFDYITSVYSAISVGSLTTTDTINSFKKHVQLTPAAMYFTAGIASRIYNQVLPFGGSGKSFFPSPLFFLGNCFAKWRGGFKFRVKIAKTKFHTGRLILGFIPTPNPVSNLTTNLPTNPSNMQFKSVIWDLRESNSCEFECPFIHPMSYLDFTRSFGTFFISVLDPLDGPATVAQTVPFVLEVAGMPGFEYSHPRTPLYPLAPLDTVYIAQSGIDAVFRSPTTDGTSALCVGEKINSVKQMIARACTVGVYNSSRSVVFEPLLNSGYWTPSAAAPTALEYVDNTYLNYFQGLYGISRGGYHNHIIPMGIDTVVSATLEPTDRLASAPIIAERSTALHVKVPYYNYRSRDIIGDPIAQFGASNLCKVNISLRTGGPTGVIHMVRAAEDFQMGYFLGAPPLAIPFGYSSTQDDELVFALSSDH